MFPQLMDKVIILVIVSIALIVLGVPSMIAGLIGVACAFGKFILNMAI